MKNRLLFILILTIGFILRVYGINWDNGFHLHPDERMLIMVADRLHFFDQLNPDFFNYGSLPIYLLKGITQLIDSVFNSHSSNYDGMLYAGRMLSTIFDLVTIVIIYKIVEILFKSKTIASFSSFFYAIAFFPIQNSHFFVVDVYLTTFTTLLVYFLMKYVTLPSRHDRRQDGKGRIIRTTLIGLTFAAMLTTKFTAIIFLPIIIFMLLIKNKKTSSPIFNSCPVASLLCFGVSLIIFSFLFMPYAFIEHKRFISDVLAQIRMNSDPYIFPYTLQYVGTTPYLYYLKNIFLWGLGPVISVLSLVGLIQVFDRFLISCHSRESGNLFNRFRIKCGMTNEYFLFFIFYFFYFLIIGRSAVKFMRYMLPIYPFLAVMAGYGFCRLFLPHRHSERSEESLANARKYSDIRQRFFVASLLRMTQGIIVILPILWTLFFINIYSQKHTRVAATEWILKNVPFDSTLAVEHWDDRVPIYGGEKYNYVEMTLYERPDDEIKWQGLNEKLKQADYIILASNRLYVPLQKLSDCQKYKSCYPKTAEYYKKLFNSLPVIPSEAPLSGAKRGIFFQKVAEFAVYPSLKIDNWKLEFRDEGADESFTVYDHPRVMVFKKSYSQ